MIGVVGTRHRRRGKVPKKSKKRGLQEKMAKGTGAGRGKGEEVKGEGIKGLDAFTHFPFPPSLALPYAFFDIASAWPG